MPLNGLRWSRNSGSANCDMPQSAVFGRPGGVKRKAFENVLQKACSVICSWCYFLMRKRGNFAVSKIKHDEQILFIIGEGAC